MKLRLNKIPVATFLAVTILTSGAFAQDEAPAPAPSDSESSSSSSGVGLFVEPGVTYEKGDTRIDYPNPFDDSTGTLKGLGVGARVGAHVYGALFVALDGRYSQPQWTDSTFNTTADSVATNLGLTVGAQMPIVGLRAWGTYIGAATMDPGEAKSLDVRFRDGRGYRIGAGFRVSLISINLEYQDISYDTAEIQKIGPFNSGTTFSGNPFSAKSWLVGVSFPLQL